MNKNRADRNERPHRVSFKKNLNFETGFKGGQHKVKHVLIFVNCKRDSGVIFILDNNF